MPSRIAIDIDSTLHHYWDQFRAVVRRLHGVDLAYEQQTTWHIPALDPERLQAAIRETHTETHVLTAVPYPGAVETVRAWHEQGHFIHITSHRSTESHDVTARWLEKVGIPYDELYCSYDKISRCVDIGIDILVDDSPVNLVRAHERGIVGATLRHPWNAELCAGEEGILHAKDWERLAAALAPLLGR